MSTATAFTTSQNSGRQRWHVPEHDSDAASALAKAASIPQLIGELLVARGIRTPADADRFLHPKIEYLLDPYAMHGMAAAVARIQAAIANHDRILIYGDYDVDGTTAIVLLKTALEMLGGSVSFHVPHRLLEGYGMRGSVLEAAATDGIRLVISVDTGIRAFEEALVAERLGIDLIVTDHHLPDATVALPRALIVLNPNQPDCEYPCKFLCGAGVAFKLAQALLEAQLDADKRERARTKTLPSFLKMLAIATVADAVPLQGENRVITAIGLQELSRPAGAGLRALMKQAQLDPARKKLTTTDIGFRLGPRINAAGRMDIASEVIELFTTRDHVRAQDLAEKLERLNTERRATELQALEQIEQRLQDDVSFADARCLVIDGVGWHRGVIGILASRVVDRLGKPAIVIAHEDGIAYGSGRSVAGFHLLTAIESCLGLFSRAGGHAHAIGFSLPSDRVPQLRARLEAYAMEHITAEMPIAPLECDAMLPLESVTPNLFRWLRMLEPVGIGNPEPVFVAFNVRVCGNVRVLKERHIKLSLSLGTGTKTISALGWHWAARASAMGIAEGSLVDIAYKIRENDHPEWSGLEIEICSLRLADQQ